VLAAPAQTACVRDITTAAGLAQPMVSHHLQILHRAALVTRTKHGSYVYYQADTAALTHLTHQLTALSNGDPRRRRSVTAAPATTVAGCAASLCTISEASGSDSDRPAVQ
jgi:DNA-binding transcriptional ArsR family regulator